MVEPGGGVYCPNFYQFYKVKHLAASVVILKSRVGFDFNYGSEAMPILIVLIILAGAFFVFQVSNFSKTAIMS